MSLLDIFFFVIKKQVEKNLKEQ